MYLLYLLNVVVLLSFGIGVSSSPLAQSSSSKCNARDIAIVKRTANEPTYFCAWWNSDTRTRTPFMELTVSQVDSACKCISNPTKNERAAPIDHTIVSKGQSVESCSVEMSKQFTEPWHFCNFYTAYPRTTSPFRKYSAKSLLSLCDCVEGKLVSSTTKKSSTEKTSTTKTTIKSSSTKSSSSKKPTLSSAKTTKTSSSLRTTSTPKSSTSSSRKTTSSSKMVSSTKSKTSSSSTRSVSSASRSAVSKSLTFTSIKPSSSSKVTTTSSSKLSSRTSDSIKSSSVSSSRSVSSPSSSVSTTSTSTTRTSSSAGSASATKTPTGRTDGQFYLRVANATEPLNDESIDGYYVIAGEGYGIDTSRETLFRIDSNGYLYQSDGLDEDWVAIINNQGYIANSGEFGQYSAANLRCTYDDSYLLSCATTSADGVLDPVIFSYNGDFDWLGFHESDASPTMNLYVELAVSSATSTTSSSSSTTPFTTVSTAVDTASSTTSTSTATTASTCNLIPRLPNGGFEDGTDQTAWSDKVDSFSSWAPTTMKPLDGTFSGQFTFSTSSNLTQASSKVILKNTLSDLCPKSQYSISYSSYCDVSVREECYIYMWTSETRDKEEYSSRTLPGNDWVSNDHAFMFTAGSSSTTLHVYVGTTTDTRDVGYIYVDDFSIALSERDP